MRNGLHIAGFLARSTVLLHQIGRQRPENGATVRLPSMAEADLELREFVETTGYLTADGEPVAFATLPPDPSPDDD